jgi:NAD(P)H-quinone oxidoreductase subunit 6
MNIEQILFYVMGALVLGSALMVVTTQNLVRSIFVFFITLFSVAGLYVFALADFIALTQVVIYVGGVLVLMLFAFLLSNKELLNNLQIIKTRFIGIHHLPGLLVALLFLFILISMIVQVDVNSLDWIQSSMGRNTIQPSDNTTHQIGILIMTKYLLPFEVISILLMMALIGAAHLARKEKAE